MKIKAAACFRGSFAFVTSEIIDPKAIEHVIDMLLRHTEMYEGAEIICLKPNQVRDLRTQDKNTPYTLQYPEETIIRFNAKCDILQEINHAETIC